MITDDNQGGSANVSPRVDFAHSKPRKKVPAYISSYTVIGNSTNFKTLQKKHTVMNCVF